MLLQYTLFLITETCAVEVSTHVRCEIFTIFFFLLILTETSGVQSINRVSPMVFAVFLAGNYFSNLPTCDFFYLHSLSCF